MARGAHVVLACRSMDKCALAAQELTQRAPQGSCECSAVDLEDLQSVRAFAARHRAALKRKGQTLQVLVNNAGIMGPPNRPDGEDRHLWANHLGPYLLTRCLLPAFPEQGGGRIINVASRAHYWGSVKVVRDGSGSRPPEARQQQHEPSSSGSGEGQWRRFDSHPSHWFHQYARSKLLNVVG